MKPAGCYTLLAMGTAFLAMGIAVSLEAPRWMVLGLGGLVFISVWLCAALAWAAGQPKTHKD